ncbi:Pantothenate kinase-related protein Tda10 (topoisomerase I damage affected protein) [Micromonospora nigra]|uniref:Pantothenate kinase-related protein Tda10 (Topoisomerase I damage affected protein) n=1 Tax=Micromonospora nigra TaxID=145857 RepID=A0A1C6S7G3_9ACTN|nr:kinase-like protein [Micromonospora nigra]SCL25386.1 Pantothenate kinase-related protein Tda10 (topoisomerase I damage affected protein) [Micromonospora nigra]
MPRNDLISPRVDPISDAATVADVRRHLVPILSKIVDSRPVSRAELRTLAAATRDDPLPAAFDHTDDSADSILRDRIGLLRTVGRPFARWWASYFPDGSATVPVDELWRLYLPFSQWILAEKRRRRPDGLFLVGFNGSPGAGKTVLTNALAVVLNHLLDPVGDGQAVARSGDDWYLGRGERERLIPQGYDPGVPGVSNRSAPGTHDLDWLKRNLREMENSTPGSVIRMGNFDKLTDDHPAGENRHFVVRGKVGVFLFDLWFAGARTDVDPGRVPDGLRRRVAEHLRSWGDVFDRMDALWSFAWPPFEQMVADREAQQRLMEMRRGPGGMGRNQIRAFMTYMIERSWDWRTTSPVPRTTRSPSARGGIRTTP